MKIRFFLKEKKTKVAIKMVDQPDVRFLGVVKSCSELTEEMQRIADSLLDDLFNIWKERYESLFQKENNCEFRYESMKWLKMKSFKLLDEKRIKMEKLKMSITAVCIFLGQEKSFWINTGSEMVYAYDENNGFFRKLTSNKKKLASAKEQSIFSISNNYVENMEGFVIDTPKAIYIVSAEVKLFFENCINSGLAISRKDFNTISQGQKKPIFIGEIYGN